jgi:aryl-alcohol dehydrogenase-like predicted oxidoreductase
MKTDYIDIMQLHSPSYDDLMNGDGIEGLKKAQEQGKIRYDLFRQGALSVSVVDKAQFDLGIDPDKANPVSE